jgi:hypothetical protein
MIDNPPQMAFNDNAEHVRILSLVREGMEGLRQRMQELALQGRGRQLAWPFPLREREGSGDLGVRKAPSSQGQIFYILLFIFVFFHIVGDSTEDVAVPHQRNGSAAPARWPAASSPTRHARRP